MSATQGQNVVEGSRLSYDGALCTVRYVGEVAGTTGHWLGVEWDDPERGKHSGEHQGVKYFQCKTKHPTAGSFIRPGRACDKPLSFLDAAHEKYVSELESLGPPEGGNRSSPSAAAGNAPIEISGKVVEEVGFEKIRRLLAELQELRIVLLDGTRLQGVLADLCPTPSERQTELNKIKETCPKITEVDLSRNLLQTWAEVTDLCLQLSELKVLRLNGNRFHSVEETRTLPGVSQLSLNETLLSWKEIVSLTDRLPTLSALSLSSNELSTISPGLTGTVRDLTLDNNDFECLESLREIAVLPNLKTLSLQGNKLDRVYASPEPTSNNGETPQGILVFTSTLTSLDISHNNIDSWSAIDALPHVFPGLSSLRVSGNPLYSHPPASSAVTNRPERPMTADEAFMLTLSRLAQLEVLNYSKITRQDRVNGELYYLGLIRTELSLYGGGAEQRILRSNPRYHELCEAYEVADLKRKGRGPGEDSTANPRSLGARLVTFAFHVQSPASCDPGDPHNGDSGAQRSSTNDFIKEIPRSFDIYRIKAIIARHFSLPALRFRLIWETEEWDPVERGTAEEDEWDSEADEEVACETRDQPQRAPKNDQARNNDGPGARFLRREEEFMDSTKEIGFWLSDDIRSVRVRVEPF